MNAVEYKKAVNAGKIPAPKVDPFVVLRAKFFSDYTRRYGFDNGAAAYRNYVNGGAK